MTLKEYQLGDRTFLFDDGDVPEGAELVGDVKRSRAPGSFEKLVVQANPLIKREKAEAARVADLEAEVERLTAELVAATAPAEPEAPADAPKVAEKPADKAAPAPANK